MESSKNVPSSAPKNSGSVKAESEEKSESLVYALSEEVSDSSVNVIEMSDSEAPAVPVPEAFTGTQRRGPGRPRKEGISSVVKKIHR